MPTFEGVQLQRPCQLQSAVTAQRAKTGAPTAALSKARAVSIFLLLYTAPFTALLEGEHSFNTLRCNAYLECGQLQCPRQLQLAVTEQRVGQVQPLMRFSLVVCVLGGDSVYCRRSKLCQLAVLVSVRACLWRASCPHEKVSAAHASSESLWPLSRSIKPAQTGGHMQSAPRVSTEQDSKHA